MAEIYQIKPDIHWIGVKDPGLRTFDDLFPTAHGTTYNSYLIKGRDKIAVIDTVKGDRGEEYLEKIRQLVDPAHIDYFVVNHTEPDHSGSLEFMLWHCPKAKVVSTQAAHTFLGNLIHTPFPSQIVKDGEVLDLGGKRLRFLVVPFLHWPDTMFALLEEDEVIFTCDAFGSHYCGPSIFNDELPDFSADMQFYFDTIMRPFKDKALTAIDKIRNEKIAVICPSHGPVLRSEPWKTVDRYEGWCRPEAGGKKIVLFYISPHGNTEKMAASVAKGAAAAGVAVDVRHITELSAAQIRDLMETGDALIFGIPTINRDIPKPMWDVLAYLSTVRLKTNIAAVFGSYGWSGEACRLAEDRLKGQNFKLPVPFVRAPFTPRVEALEQCEALGRVIAEEVLKK
jgi:flavorubredoxin